MKLVCVLSVPGASRSEKMSHLRNELQKLVHLHYLVRCPTTRQPNDTTAGGVAEEQKAQEEHDKFRLEDFV